MLNLLSMLNVLEFPPPKKKHLGVGWGGQTKECFFQVSCWVMLNPLPCKSASFICHVEYVECLGTPPPPPKKINLYSSSMWFNISIFGWVGGGQTKNASFSCHVKHVESFWIPPPENCFFQLWCWNCWICWMFGTYPPSPPKQGPDSAQNIQHIQHDSWKKHFFLQCHSTWFNLFNMTALRSTFSPNVSEKGKFVWTCHFWMILWNCSPKRVVFFGMFPPVLLPLSAAQNYVTNSESMVIGDQDDWMTGGPDRTMEMKGGSTASYLTRTLCVLCFCLF